MKTRFINWRPSAPWQWFAVLWLAGLGLAFGLSLAAKAFIAVLRVLFN